MSDFPTESQLPISISTYSPWSPTGGRGLVSGTVVSITWPVANSAFYIPIALPWMYPVRRVFWINGSSVTSTNMDFGIFTEDGVKLYSTGSVAQSGSSAVQYTTPTEFVLAPGAYYFALACSSITANRGGQGNTSQGIPKLRLAGFLQQATALPLPANMTPATVANSCWPFCGVTRLAS